LLVKDAIFILLESDTAEKVFGIVTAESIKRIIQTVATYAGNGIVIPSATDNFIGQFA
jgi:hypothetical protein